MSATLCPVSFEAEKAELVKLLIQTGAFHYSDEPTFKLASGQLSKFYVNCKCVFSYAEFRRLVGTWIYRLEEPLVASGEIQAVGGLVYGACPIANAVSDAAHVDKKQLLSFIIRKEKKGHGLDRLVEGAVKPGMRVLIVDDVVTSGGSTIEAIDKAVAEGLKVVAAVAIVDRQEQNGAERIRAKNLPFTSLCTRDELISAWNARRKE